MLFQNSVWMTFWKEGKIASIKDFAGYVTASVAQPVVVGKTTAHNILMDKCTYLLVKLKLPKQMVSHI